MVKAARCRTACKSHRTWIRDDRVKQITKRVEGAVFGHNNYAGIGTDGTNETDLIGGHAGIGILRQTR